MRLAPALTPTAAPRLASTGGRGSANANAVASSTTRIVPDGLLPLAAATLDDMSAWDLDEDWSAANGQITKVPGTKKRNANYSLAVPAGDVWVAYTVQSASAGTLGAQMVGTLITAPFTNKVVAQHVARFQSTGHTKVRLNANAGFDGTVQDMQVLHMDALLAQPSAGQSLMAAESQSGPVDPARDYWMPRCLYVPNHTSNTYGTTVGTVAACVGPLQMTSASQGVSPALSFAREVEAVTSPGRTILILACAAGGTSLIGDGAEWNPAGTTGDGASLYNNMVSMAQAAVARTPGSTIKGLLWAQGESDRAPTIGTDYPPAFAAMLAQLRSDLSLPSLPAAVIGPMPDDTSPHQPTFIQAQEQLDQGSGHSNAIPGVHYIARDTGYMSSDGTHPLPEGNRRAGLAAAARFIAEGIV